MKPNEEGQVIVPRVLSSGPEVVTLETYGEGLGVFVTVGRPDDRCGYKDEDSRVAVVNLSELLAACLTLSKHTAPQVDELLDILKARRNRHIEHATTQAVGSHAASFASGQIQEAARVCAIVTEWAARHRLSKAEV